MIRSLARRHRRAAMALGVGLGASALLFGTMRPLPMHAQPGDVGFNQSQVPDISSLSSAELASSNEVRLAQQTTTFTQPDPNSPVDTVLPAGSVVDGIATQMGADGVLWEQVNDPTGMALGWMHLTDFQAGIPTVTEDSSALGQVDNLLPEDGAVTGVTFIPITP